MENLYVDIGVKGLKQFVQCSFSGLHLVENEI